MSNLRSLNQQQPFWDWANGFDRPNQAGPSDFWGHSPEYHEHPGSPREGPPPPEDGEKTPPPPPPPGHRGPPPPHGHHGPPPPPEEHEPPPPPPGPHGPPHGPGHRGHGPRHHEHPRGGHGPRGGGRGRCGGGRGRHGGPPPFGGRGPFGSGFGGFGGRGRAPFDLSNLATWVQNNFGGDFQRGAQEQQGSQDFTPAIDIFNAEEAYVVHASLPGAAKEDIAVNWDAASSTLILTGVVHRPGDEQLMRGLEVSERQVGAFERKVVLGTAQEPAHVDEDMISAKLEHGVLRVTVPKLGEEDVYVEVKKVDIQ